MSNVVAMRKKQPAHRPWQQVNHTPEQIKKATKALDREAIDELEALDAPALKTYLADLANHEETVTVAKAKDPDLKDLKDQMKVINQGYNEQLKGVRARRTYVCWLIDQMV